MTRICPIDNDYIFVLLFVSRRLRKNLACTKYLVFFGYRNNNFGVRMQLIQIIEP